MNPAPSIEEPKPDGKELVTRAASGSDSANRGQIIASWNRWRERYNPLRGLTLARAVQLLEQYQRGEMADPQWVYFFLESSDADLFALVERRTSALLEMDWAIKQVAPEKDPAGKVLWPVGYDESLAQEQAAALREAYEGIDNVYEAIAHLALATFRGFSHCEKHRNADGDIYHLELVDQWNCVRDLLRGGWRYNPTAISTLYDALPADMDMLPQNFLLREKDRHVNRLALVKAIRANLGEKDWDAFVEIYGIPSGVIVGPPNVPAEKEQEYKAAAQNIAEGGSGYLPNGSDYKPNDAPRGAAPFKARLDHLTEKLILAGTGGLLTMLAQSGSGTLAGNAHADTFATLARGEARAITEIFQRQLDAEILNAQFAGRPRLAYFEIAANDETDPADLVTQVAALGTAGYLVDPEQLSERLGLKITLKPQPAAPAPGAKEPEEEEDPLLPNAPRRPALQNRGGGKPLAPFEKDPQYRGFVAACERAYASGLAEDLAPLRSALRDALQGDEEGLSARLQALNRRLPELAKKVIPASKAGEALYRSLSAALANMLAAKPSQ